MSAPGWSTQQLAEFLAIVSAAKDEGAAALAAVERTAEAFDAEAAAIVCAGEIVTAVGYPDGRAPVGELVAVTPGANGRKLNIPGVGACPATGVALEHPPGATLVVARSGRGLSREESGLLRGMARAISMTMRMLRLLDQERAARSEAGQQADEITRLLDKLTERQQLLERLAEEQAALRRVATLVARRAAPADLFSAVAEEVAQLLPVDFTYMERYGTDLTATIVAGWHRSGHKLPVGSRYLLGGTNLATVVARTGRPTRQDRYTEDDDPLTVAAREVGVRSAVGTPIVVEGRLWGVMIAGTTTDQPLPADTEGRCVDFTDLVATAIANAESRSELAASRARVVDAADETRRRIERDLHDGTQQRLVSLGLELRAVQSAVPQSLGELRSRLSCVADRLGEVLEELQEISRGIHPAILSKGGLGPAIKSLARRSAVPVELTLATDRRLPERVEVALYYVVSEALTNAAKHARASVVYVEFRTDGAAAELSIRDDGIGGADLGQGSGLIGIRDRVETLGGTIDIASAAGVGTSLLVTVPIGAA